MVAAILGGIGGILGGIGGIFGSKSNADAMREANQMNYRMYKEDREYNTPVNQMARLKAAGLNPHLVYGNGSVVGNTSGGAPQMQAPTQDYSSIGDLAQIPANYLNLKQRSENLKQLELTTENVRDTNNKIKAETKVSNANARQIEAMTKRIERGNAVNSDGTPIADTDPGWLKGGLRIYNSLKKGYNAGQRNVDRRIEKLKNEPSALTFQYWKNKFNNKKGN